MTNNNLNEIFNDLVQFITSKCGITNLNLTKNHLIEDDLGITGEDASELISEYSNKYNVDITNFTFAKYFNEEPSAFSFFTKRIKPLCVGNLHDGILTGKLNDEVIGKH